MSDPELSETERQIAEDQMQYLRDNPDVCAEGSVTGCVWMRYADGEWRGVNHETSRHRLRSRIRGTVFDRDEALRWFLNNPVTIRPVGSAGSQGEVWDDTDEQDVFTDAERCYWCGASERSVDLDVYRTVEQGECRFCSDCRDSWDRADELADGSEVVA